MVKSPEAVARARAYCREMYWWYRDHGICVYCKKAYAEPARSRCRFCARKQNARAARKDPGHVAHNATMKAWRAQKRAEGMCSRCGQRKATEGYKSCASCREYQKEYYLARRVRERIRRENEKEAR